MLLTLLLKWGTFPKLLRTKVHPQLWNYSQLMYA